jgi:hypothetical protein
VTFSVIRDGDRYQLFDTERVLLARGSRGKVLMRLLPALNSALLKNVSSLAVHAGAVARSGIVIAFPGRSGTGKSACLQHGLGYVSDEALIIEPASGEVIPYPKPLWLSAETRRLLDLGEDELSTFVEEAYKAPVVPEALGGGVAGPPLQLGHLVILEPGDDPPRFTGIDPGFTAHTLLRNAFNRYQQPEAWFHLAAELARNVRGWRLEYRDPREAAELIAERLS